MKRTDFSYELPQELIAQYPLSERVASRLLHLDRDSGEVSHHQFPTVLDFLDADDLLVFNDTRVIPARMWGRKETGGRLEILIERITGTHEALAHIRCSKSPRPGTGILLSAAEGEEPGHHRLEVTGREGDLFRVSSAEMPLADILTDIGHMPLPPYIEREDEASDKERYQTVYAQREGAVAAPTAGLHFDTPLMEEIDRRGIRRVNVTLHVGAGTFQPVRAEKLEEHVMHSEFVEVDEQVCEAVRLARQRGARIVAVGTTSVRSLEAASRGGEIEPYAGDTDIFIYPPYEFRSVDAMITNFHLPESTLLMLVSAFAGRGHIMGAYQQAIAERYRFFSYGDAMFIGAKPSEEDQV